MKGKKIIFAIIVILILFLMAGVAFAYVYTATDLLKSDKELFFKYFAQITSEDGFLDKRIQDFNEKKEQTPYENSGEITVGIEYPEDSMDEIVEKVNDLSIRFSGKVDSLNQQVEQNIEVDYGNDVIFPINYKQSGDNFGLQTNELSKKYIAIRNENLKQFAASLGLEDVSEIPDKIELAETTDKLSFTDEEIEQLKQIYFSVLEQNLLDENFSSIKTEENECYTLELNSEQVKNIVIQMLEATKQNTLLIDKINEIMLEQDYDAETIDVSTIDEWIEDINGEGTSNNLTDIPNLKLTLIQSNKKLEKITIQSGESKISIEKKESTESLRYYINCEVKNEEETESGSIFEEATSRSMQYNLYFNVKYTGLETLSNVQENYEFGIEASDDEETMKYDYEINTKTIFMDTVSIEALDESVAVFLNNYEGTQVTAFMTNVVTKLLEINKNQMAKLGLEEYENPVLYSNPITMIGIMVYNMASESVDNVDFSSQEISAFNDKFTQYVGDDIRGADVNALIKTVQNNLLSSAGTEGHFVIVTLDGTEVLENVDSTKTYNIEAVYDEEGYISEMKVTSNN